MSVSSFAIFKRRRARRSSLAGIGLVFACALSLLACAAAARGQETKERGAIKTEPATTTATNPVFGAVDPLVVLRSARTIYIRSKSVYFKSAELENELRRKPEFQQLGILITRDETNADLIIEVGRKVFTSKFIYSVIDARSQIILMTGKVDSIGGTAAGKVGGEVIRKILTVRPLDPSVKVVP